MCGGRSASRAKGLRRIAARLKQLEYRENIQITSHCESRISIGDGESFVERRRMVRHTTRYAANAWDFLSLYTIVARPDEGPCRLA